MTHPAPSYRPHDPGHDYYAPGIYLVTLVVRGRRENAQMFGTLGGDVRQPAVVLNEVGKAVMRCWAEIPERQAWHGRKVAIHAAVCMPDHFHGVIEIKERMDVSLGEVICGFKIGCTQAWRRLAQSGASVAAGSSQPYTAAMDGEGPADMGPSVAVDMGPFIMSEGPYMAPCPSGPDLHRMSKKQRAAYYAAHPETQQPLWDDNYDDTICLNDPATGTYCQRHFAAMVQYVGDNARRALVMRLRPQFMQRCLHVRIACTAPDGTPAVRDYAAFGNLFLLRWARKVQVFCHRKARFGMLTPAERTAAGYTYQAAADMVTRIPYETTAAFRHEHDNWVAQVMAGATVVVTPGISKGEQLMKNECLAKGYPLIHLQKEPIGALWKPEKMRFDACTNGRLLILAPWKVDELGDVEGVPSDTDYSVFHNLNTLAEEICLFEGEAVVIM